MTVQFAELTASEAEAVSGIVDRALAMYRQAKVKENPLSIRMDLSAVHATCPLRLYALLEADDFNFAHDMGGIRRHLNRETGELEDCFVPRFAA